MFDALAVAALVVLVNGACMLSFDRAQRALRDLGAAWVRALAAPSRPVDQPAEPDDDEPSAGDVVVAPRAVLLRVPL